LCKLARQLWREAEEVAECWGENVRLLQERQIVARREKELLEKQSEAVDDEIRSLKKYVRGLPWKASRRNQNKVNFFPAVVRSNRPHRSWRGKTRGYQACLAQREELVRGLGLSWKGK